MRSTQKIVHMTTVHHPFDPRIYHKECKSIKDAGFDLTYLAQKDPNTGETSEEIHQIPLPTYDSKLKRMLFAPWKAYKVAKKLNADIYHFHDPELMFVARLLKNKRNIVVYDVHEDFVTSLIKKDYLNKFMKAVIRKSFRWIEKIITKPFKKVLAEKYYEEIYPNGKWVLNYPTVNENFMNQDRSGKPIEDKLIYTGNVDLERGAEIHANLPNVHPTISMHFIGKCPSRFADRINEIAGANQDRIHITGVDQFVPKEEIERSYLDTNWLAGIALFPPTEHYLKKELTKFFEYMNAGLPIICSNFERWQEFIDQNQCGIAVDPYDEKEIYEAIEYLRNHPDEAKRMGQNGKKAVQEKLNWNTQANHLVELYDEWLSEIQ